MASPFLKTALTSVWRVLVCEVRCEGGGEEANIGFPSQYQPIPPAFDFHWKLPKIAFNFYQSCQKENPVARNWNVQPERIAEDIGLGGLVHGWEVWPALDYLSLHCNANAPPASASLVYCTCRWPSAYQRFREFLHQIMYKERGNVHWSAGRANEQVTKILFTAEQAECWKEHLAECWSTKQYAQWACLILMPRMTKSRDHVCTKTSVLCFLLPTLAECACCVYMLVCIDTGVQCSLQYCLAI